jgi:hypothetical protein
LAALTNSLTNQGWFHACDDLFASFVERLLHTRRAMRQARRADQRACTED